MTVMALDLSAAERDYLVGQRLGRLASIDAHGQPQNNPVGFFLNDELGVIDIGGRATGQTKKFRNARSNPLVSLVVDDLASVRPWHVRGVEIRGHAEGAQGLATALPVLLPRSHPNPPNQDHLLGARRGLTVRGAG
jgi:pyridoxamine 5'-phosphate oxidase family protein